MNCHRHTHGGPRCILFEDMERVDVWFLLWLFVLRNPMSHLLVSKSSIMRRTVKHCHKHGFYVESNWIWRFWQDRVRWKVIFKQVFWPAQYKFAGMDLWLYVGVNTKRTFAASTRAESSSSFAQKRLTERGSFIFNVLRAFSTVLPKCFQLLRLLHCLFVCLFVCINCWICWTLMFY